MTISDEQGSAARASHQSTTRYESNLAGRSSSMTEQELNTQLAIQVFRQALRRNWI